MLPTANLPSIAPSYHFAMKTLRNIFPFLVLLLVSCITSSLWAQNNKYEIGKEVIDYEYPLMVRGATLQGYTLSPYVVEPIPALIDTVSYNFFRRIRPEGRSIAMGYTSGIASPWHNKSFFDRRKKSFDFLFNTAFDSRLYTPEDDLYYNTKAPYTKILYHQHGGVQEREEEFDFTLALNPNKYIGLGADFNYTNSLGYFAGSRTKAVSYRLFANATFDKYQLWISLGNNYFKMTENGGITDDLFVSDPQKAGSSSGAFKSSEIPVRHNGNVWNGLTNGHFRLAHKYNFGQHLLRNQADSLTSFLERRPPEDSLRFIPVASIGHILSFHRARHEYVNRNTTSYNLYEQHNAYLHNRSRQGLPDSLMFLPYDSTYMWQLNNTIQISVREGFQPWVPFGIDTYLRLENRYYYQQDTTVNSKIHTINTVLGARLARITGKKLNFDAIGEISLLGENIGSFLITGNIRTQFRVKNFPYGLRAWGTLYSQRPNYFVRQFHGSFHRWDNKFGNERALLLGGEVKVDKWNIFLQVHSGTLQNHIYFDPTAHPLQCKQAIQVLAARLNHHMQVGLLGWETEALYQTSSNAEAIPLPQLSLRGQLHLSFFAAKVMKSQVGVECSLHTPYYAPYYEPATMQFINQRERKYGNYPLINLFANFRLQRTRFFIEYYNAGQLFLTKASRFSLAHYPMLPATLRMGVCVEFFN